MKWRSVGSILAGTLWLMFCAWMFAFSYSDSYFEYNRCSRIPVFAAAMIGSAAIPVGAFLVLRRFNGVFGAIVGQIGVSGLSLVPLAATTFLLSRLPGACHLSADDAMGAGIDFLLLAVIAVFSVAATALAATVRSRRQRRGE